MRTEQDLIFLIMKMLNRLDIAEVSVVELAYLNPLFTLHSSR